MKKRGWVALSDFAGGFFEEFVDEDGPKTRWKVARPDRIGMQTAQLEGPGEAFGVQKSAFEGWGKMAEELRGDADGDELRVRV